MRGESSALRPCGAGARSVEDGCVVLDPQQPHNPSGVCLLWLGLGCNLFQPDGQRRQRHILQGTTVCLCCELGAHMCSDLLHVLCNTVLSVRNLGISTQHFRVDHVCPLKETHMQANTSTPHPPKGTAHFHDSLPRTARPPQRTGPPRRQQAHSPSPPTQSFPA